MNLRRLACFVAVAEELHFGRAAARLGMAQPPLSQQIQKLERELGVSLLVRSRRAVALTEAGVVLLERSRRLLADVDGARQITQRAARGEVGRLAIGFVSSALYVLLLMTLRELHRRASGVELALRDLTSQEIVEGILRERLDVGFVRMPLDGDGLEKVVVRREPFVLAMPTGHRLAERSVVNLRDVAHEPFLLFPRRLRPDLYDSVVGACEKAGFRPTILEQDVAPQQVILVLVAAGVGVAMVPASYQALHWEGVEYRPLSPGPPALDLALVWRNGEAKPVVRQFIDVVLGVAQRLEGHFEK